MSKTLIRLITLVLAIAMVACLAVGCGGNGETASTGSNGGSSNQGTTNNKEPGLDGIDKSVNPEDYRGTKVIYVTGGGNDYMNDSCTMRSVNGGESFEVLTRNKRNSFVTEGYGLGWEADAIACRADNGVVYVPGSCFGFATIDAYEE